MIAFFLSPIGRMLAAFVLGTAIGAGGGWTVQGYRLDAVKAEYQQFKGGVAALGRAAEKQNALIALNDLKNKERADDENRRTHTADINTILRLRRAADSARGSYVPPAPAGAARPEIACFDRAALESALRGFVGEVRGFVDEGTQATIDLNTAKIWNKNREGSAK